MTTHGAQEQGKQEGFCKSSVLNIMKDIKFVLIYCRIFGFKKFFNFLSVIEKLHIAIYKNTCVGGGGLGEVGIFFSLIE